MPDISKCSPSDCPIKESCCRFTAESSYQQAYSAFYEKGKECKWFISNKKK